MQTLVAERVLVAGHDRSDGGLATTILEMAFTGNCGVDVDVPTVVPAAPAAAGDANTTNASP